MQKMTYNTRNISVPPVWVVWHGRNVDLTPSVNEVVVGHHDSSKRSREHGMFVYEGEESLDAEHEDASVERKRKRD